MKDQHTKIKGYRDLTQEEIDLMNEIKAFGPQLQELIHKIDEHVAHQYETAAIKAYGINNDNREIIRLDGAEPEQWVEQGKRKIQEGLMALTRAVAQPEFF